MLLRRKPPGKLLPSAHAVDREYRVISALYAQGFPVAEPVLYCADEAIIGTAFFVMAYVEGRVFWEPQMPASNPAERAQVYDAMNATLARLHNFDPAKIGLGDYGRGENYVARQVERWSKQYRASETARIEEMERLIAWLPAHLPPASRRVWCMATTGSTTSLSRPTRRKSRPCSIGNSPRSAIRSPISPIT